MKPQHFCQGFLSIEAAASVPFISHLNRKGQICFESGTESKSANHRQLIAAYEVLIMMQV